MFDIKENTQGKITKILFHAENQVFSCNFSPLIPLAANGLTEAMKTVFTTKIMAKGLTSLISSYVGSSMPISMSQLYSHHAVRPSYHFSILAWLFVEYCVVTMVVINM